MSSVRLTASMTPYSASWASSFCTASFQPVSHSPELRAALKLQGASSAAKQDAREGAPLSTRAMRASTMVSRSMGRDPGTPARRRRSVIVSSTLAGGGARGGGGGCGGRLSIGSQSSSSGRGISSGVGAGSRILAGSTGAAAAAALRAARMVLIWDSDGVLVALDLALSFDLAASLVFDRPVPAGVLFCTAGAAGSERGA